MKSILVPVDGSDCSIRAIKQAVELAELYHGNITLLNVMDVKSATSFFNDKKTIQMQVDMTDRSERILEEAKRYCEGIPGRFEAVILEGNLADMIVEYAETNKFDLVVMGAHGMSGFQRFTLGSVTHKVVTHIERPILLIH